MKTLMMMMAVAVCALATGRSDGAVRTWPQPKEMARSADFALTAGGRSVYVETADAEHTVRNLRFENVTGAAPVRRVCKAKLAER